MSRKTKKNRGGQRTTWLKVIERDLDDIGMNITEATQVSLDRKEWRAVVNRRDALCAHALYT